MFFKLLSRLLSAYVPTREPMCHPGKKVLTRTRQEPSSPILEPRCRFSRKSISKSLVSYARNMEACILPMLPRIAASTKKRYVKSQFLCHQEGR